MIVIAIIFYYLVITLILIISINYLGRWLRKYIEKRIDEGLRLLNELENINNKLDNKDRQYKDKALNRCKESLKKKREMDSEFRRMTRKVKEKMSK